MIRGKFAETFTRYFQRSIKPGAVIFQSQSRGQLDDLRRAHPNVPSRAHIIERLIWEAHAKISKSDDALLKAS